MQLKWLRWNGELCSGEKKWLKRKFSKKIHFDETKDKFMTVFVTDGAERTSLVHVGGSYRFSTTGLSKYSKRSFIYPYHPKKNGLEIGKYLN